MKALRGALVVVLGLAAVMGLSGCFTTAPPASSISGGELSPSTTPLPASSVPPAATDAIPRVEPRSRYGNPPFYEVFGKRYYVLSSSAAYVERGVASWYGPGFHKVRTSTGELYDMYGMTAAHKTLPLPAYVRVTNLQNGRSVVVRVNDRGPFVGNRIIDLSYTAASRLDMLRHGTAMVEVRSIDPTAPAHDPGTLLLAAATPQHSGAAPSSAAPAAGGSAMPAGATTATLASASGMSAGTIPANATSIGVSPGGTQPRTPQTPPTASLATVTPAAAAGTAAAYPISAAPAAGAISVASATATAGTAAPTITTSATSAASPATVPSPASARSTSVASATAAAGAAAPTTAASPTTAPSATTAASPAIARTPLFVQAGAFADPANADHLADKLRGGGYGKVLIRDDLIAGRKMYRVRIGPVTGVPEFDRIVAALERAGVHDAHLALD